MNKKIYQLVVVIIICATLAFSIALVALPKSTFSENENRYLAKFPAFSVESLINGKFTEQINEWLTDHFPARDAFVGLKVQYELLTGKKEINNVFVLNDGCLIENYKAPENTDRIINILNTFSDKMAEKDTNINLQMMLIPNAVSTYADRLPGKAQTINQLDVINQITSNCSIPAIDAVEPLSSHRDDEYLYYRTDHHWTTKGAYIAYEAYCKENGLEPVSLSDMTAENVSDSFMGTLYSKVKDYRITPDNIVIYTNSDDDLDVVYTDTKETSKSLYNLEYLDKKDKYSLFLNNLHPLIEITNNNAATDKELVLVKDSYANSMVPFLAHNFRKIYVFDTRSYRTGITSFIENKETVTDILILYNMNTMDTDTGIYGIY